jgi:hypothetical protein
MFLIPRVVGLFLRKPVPIAVGTEETVNLSSSKPTHLFPFMSHRWTNPEASCMNSLLSVAVMLKECGRRRSKGETGIAAFIAAQQTT